MIILLFQCKYSLAEELETHKTKVAVEAIDQTTKFGDILCEWLKDIVIASGSFEIVPRKEAVYLMVGTLKKVQEIVIGRNGEPAFQVEFDLWMTELGPETLVPALIPKLNVTRSENKLIVTPSAEKAVKQVMTEAFENLLLAGGIHDENESD